MQVTPSDLAPSESSSPHAGVPQEDAEYEEVEDLIYERTGTLSFPYPVRIVEKGVRATGAAGTRPEGGKAASSGSGSSAWSSLGRLARDLRAASAATPGVSVLAIVDVVGAEPANSKRREPLVSPASPGVPRVVMAGPSVSQQVALAPASAPRPRSAQLAPLPNAKRTTQPSLRAKQRARRVYPSFGQRLLAEVLRLPLATRSTLSAVLATVVVAGVFFASSRLVPRRVAEATVASRSSVAAAAQERAPAPARALVEPRVSVVAAEEAPSAPDSMLTSWAPPAAFEAALPEPSPRRTPSKRRAPTPRRHEPCECLPGDPLCGCLD